MITELIRWAYSVMEYPLALLAAIPLILLIWFLIARKSWVANEELEVKQQKRRVRKWMYVTRALIIILLLIAIASPFVEREKFLEGDPVVHVLIDNSSSMAVFDDYSQQLVSALQRKVNTEVRFIGSGTTSNIGDSILNSLEPHSSVLLLSDGNANAGASLGDVALFAAKINASVNAIKLSPIKNDVGIEVFGPGKTLVDTENTFTVVLSKTGSVGAIPVRVTLDGEIIYDQTTSDAAIQFKRTLTKGVHRIIAEVNVQDFFDQNNKFYKTVRVVDQPKILLLTQKSSPMDELLKQVYLVDISTEIPDDLGDYYAVVVNDMPVGPLDRMSDVLNDFVADGNGLVVFGGQGSYEHGDYRNSLFESMLPVVVGSPEREEGDTAIAIVIDISGSQGSPFGRFASTADFSKAATLDIMRNVKPDTRVAIIAFNTDAYLLSEPSPMFSKKDVEGLIARLKWGGGTNVAAGIMKAVGVLNTVGGSKNVVILSDGKTQGSAQAIEAAKFASNSGVRIYSVGVGPSTDEAFMINIADLTNGIYFRATEESRLNILFGPVDEREVESGRMNLVVLNKNHFITADFEPDATLYGFNQVSPKSAARLLATTSTGEPVLTVWRLGLGRVAAFSVDDGSSWAGSLLSEANSRIITRTLSWVVGDPERKNTAILDASDTRIGEATEITVRSSIPPTAEGVAFYEADDNTYVASVISDAVGFQKVAGVEFAVNHESEFSKVGVSVDLPDVVASSGGKMFNVKDIDAIVDHAKTKAKRLITGRQYVREPFVILAIILLLGEIFIRRLIRKQ
ncbi:hypothetical protein COV18_07350 [Candidatus Woesearchaeota archaeon CG10_big_fil_rev_8_21_14_0_10_37_12]|nr:MAG: hypothetical protein COV18_07350 [Candidatus Woesearchaeota archaeon CG10_big_fil_rev_8_21_14_0_10_37_12]